MCGDTVRPEPKSIHLARISYFKMQWEKKGACMASEGLIPEQYHTVTQPAVKLLI